MKKIAVVTSTRAEYGLLYPVIRELRKFETSDLKAELIVTGTHISEQYGMTIREIYADGIRIDHTIPISINSETEMDISSNQADALIKFTELFLKEKYDALILLGDRYETLSIAIAAGNTRTPIFHLCGGDTTEGAMDEWIRHSITKISCLHFVTNKESWKRVVQLGEDPSRVLNYGSTSIDNMLSVAEVTKVEALASINMDNCRYAICTYHPVTMENGSVDYKITELLKSMELFPEIQFIVTKSNADQGGARINQLIDVAAERIENLHVFASLGVRRYLSLMKHAEFVLGNSSSGIIETSTFRIPTVNIGNRQRGRLQPDSIINCDEDFVSISEAIKKAMSKEYKTLCAGVINPYGDGHAAKRIASKIIDEIVVSGSIDIKKKFYDIKV